MLRDFAVSPNGHQVEKWLNGEVHDNVPEALAEDLIVSLIAVEVTGNRKRDEQLEAEAIGALEEDAKRAQVAAAVAAAAKDAALEAATQAMHGA